MKYSFELEEKEVQLIGLALGKLPYEQVAPFLAKLQKLVTEQENKSKDETKDSVR